MNNQNCNDECPVRKQLQEEYSIKRDIELSILVLVISVGVIVFMTWFM